MISQRIARVGAVIILIYLILLLGPVAGFDLPTILSQMFQIPQLLVQQGLIGLANGGIIAIIALGYTLVYGIIELVNFAHGDLFMLGAFASLTVIGLLGVNEKSSAGSVILAILATLVIASAFTAGVNVFIERVAYRPLRNAPRLAALIAALGVSFILQNVGLIWGGLRFTPQLKAIMGSNSAAPKSFPDLLPRDNLLAPLGITSITFSLKDLIVILSAILLMIGLRLFVQNTKMGKAMRAVSQNRTAAIMMGIDVDQVIAFTFLLGGLLAGSAGLLVGLYNNTAVFTMGFTAGLRAFTAAVLGGIGNITGAMFGGLLIGLIAAFSDQYISSRWTNAWIFAVLIVILVFRPSGLLGENVQEKA